MPVALFFCISAVAFLYSKNTSCKTTRYTPCDEESDNWSAEQLHVDVWLTASPDVCIFISTLCDLSAPAHSYVHVFYLINSILQQLNICEREKEKQTLHLSLPLLTFTFASSLEFFAFHFDSGDSESC